MIAFGLFPKFMQQCSAGELAERCAECGLDAVNAVLRDGFWTPASDLAGTLPGFTAAIRNAGLACNFATWAVPPQQVLDQPDTLRALVDHGITGFRMGYLRQESGESWMEAIARGQHVLAQVAALCADLGIRPVYQVHHGMLVTCPEGAATLCEGLPGNLGIMLDIGNQGFEGACAPNRADAILGDRWSDLGVKDVQVNGRGRRFAPCQDGIHDWQAIATAWAGRPRVGCWVLQPFYHEQDIEAHCATLKAEVAWLRQQTAEATP